MEEADWKQTKKPSIVYDNMLMKVRQYINLPHKNSTVKIVLLECYIQKML